MSLLRIQKLPWDIQESDYNELSDLLMEAFGDESQLDYTDFKQAMWDRARSKNFTFVLKLEEHIIGTASVICERKLIRAGKLVAHLEEVAISKSLQGQGYGKILMKYIEGFCIGLGCRKIILDCSDENVGFYSKLGFTLKEHQMRLDI